MDKRLTVKLLRACQGLIQAPNLTSLAWEDLALVNWCLRTVKCQVGALTYPPPHGSFFFALSFCLSFCQPVCLLVCLSSYLCLFQSLSITVCLTVCVLLSVSLSACLSACLALPVSHSLSLSLSSCVSVCFNLFLWLPVSLCLTVCLAACLSVSPSVLLSAFCLSVMMLNSSPPCSIQVVVIYSIWVNIVETTNFTGILFVCLFVL